MAQSCEIPMSRIDARIPLAARNIIDLAAAMQGRSRTDFLIEAVLEKAEKVIADQTVISLTMKDQQLLANALHKQEVMEPTPFLKELAGEYTVRVKSR